MRSSCGKGQSLAWYDAPRLDEQNLAFRNGGELQFRDVSKKWGLDNVGISFGAAVEDLDNDGDLDIVVNNFESAPSIYRNGTVDQNSCKIQLEGGESNRQAIGASVKIETSESSHFRYHNPSGGFLSCDDAVMHVGLGGRQDNQVVDRSLAQWRCSDAHRRRGQSAVANR